MFFGWRLGQFFEYVVLLHGLSFVIRYWRNDLVEARRKARLAFLLIVGSAVGVATVSLNFGLYHEYIRGIITGLAAFATLICLVTAREGIMDLVGSDRPAGSPQPQPRPTPEKSPRRLTRHTLHNRSRTPQCFAEPWMPASIEQRS